MYIHTYIYIYTCKYIYAHKHTYTYTYTYTYIYTNTNTYTYIYTYTYTYTNTHLYTYVKLFVNCSEIPHTQIPHHVATSQLNSNKSQTTSFHKMQNTRTGNPRKSIKMD